MVSGVFYKFFYAGQTEVWTSGVKVSGVQIKYGITSDNATQNTELSGVPTGLYLNQRP